MDKVTAALKIAIEALNRIADREEHLNFPIAASIALDEIHDIMEGGESECS